MSDRREIAEGKQTQGEDESIIYTLTTTNWVTNPTTPSAKIFSVVGLSSFTDVTSTNMSGISSVSGDVITLPTAFDLVVGTVYRVEVQFTANGNTFEAYAWVECER